MYVTTIETLARIFGKGPSFDEWYARQQAMLATMRKDLAQPAPKRRSRRSDHRLAKLFTEAKASQAGAQALAG
jgi:hypothetical protein